jgi:hypothetical protein
MQFTKGECTMIARFKASIGLMFSLIFLAIALFLTALAMYQFYAGLTEGKELVNIFIQSINTLIISLALFELGLGIGKEYATHDEEPNTYAVVRRTIARFVGTVCIALVLESLIMIIKYSQLDLAGNLYYPVGIMAGASVLLSGMGLFLHLTRADCHEREEETAWRPVLDREGMPLARPDRQVKPQGRRAA